MKARLGHPTYAVISKSILGRWGGEEFGIFFQNVVCIFKTG